MLWFFLREQEDAVGGKTRSVGRRGRWEDALTAVIPVHRNLQSNLSLKRQNPNKSHQTLFFCSAYWDQGQVVLHFLKPPTKSQQYLWFRSGNNKTRKSVRIVNALQIVFTLSPYLCENVEDQHNTFAPKHHLNHCWSASVIENIRTIP